MMYNFKINLLKPQVKNLSYPLCVYKTTATYMTMSNEGGVMQY